MHSRVHTRRLIPSDARAIATLEEDTYPVELRAGRRKLELDIEDADWENCNLGIGLFDGDELVGIFLAYYEADSRRLFDYFGAPRPAGQCAEESLYVADFIVRRPYSRYTRRLFADWMSLIRPYYGLPMLGFSTRPALDRWLARKGALARVGYGYAGAQRLELDGPPHEVFMVRFEASLEPAERSDNLLGGLRVEAVQTRLGWERLAADWDVLLHQTPDWTSFQSLEIQNTWWDHFANDSRLFILVVRDGKGVRAIAPLRIVNTLYYGRLRRLVKFIGEHGEMDRPTILRRGEDREAIEAIFGYLNTERGSWDALMLYEQPLGGAVSSVARKLLAETMLVGIVPGPPCPWVDVRGSWAAFLASKSSGFRKSLRRKLARLCARGEVSFSTRETWPAVDEAFQDYLDVERRSWKPEQKLGVAKSAASLDYHQALVNALGPRGGIVFRTLFLDGMPIAATFGLLERGQFLSLHIAHDRKFDEYSPGVLLTAYELEECYGRADHVQYELLGGFLENKTSWTANARETQQLYLYRREPMFAIHYAWHFRLKPIMKRGLKKLGLFSVAFAIKKALWMRLFPIKEPEA